MLRTLFIIAALLSLSYVATAQDGENAAGAGGSTSLEAELTVVKSVSADGGASWLDAQLAPGLAAAEGDPLHYLIQIINSGDYALTDIRLTDALVDVSGCALPAALEPGELTECVVGPAVAGAGETVNTVLVTARHDGRTITATDSAYAFAGDVSVLRIEKMAGLGGAWFAADTAPGLSVPAGSDLWFRITVTNDGTTTFTDITLADSMLSLASCAIPDALAPGLSFECLVGPVDVDENGPQVNTAVVTAAANGGQYTASDDAHFVVSDDDSGPIIIIEGPITAINGNVVVIFDIDIHLPDNDPTLTAVRIGDLVRIEGDTGENNIIIAIVVVIIDVDIYVGEDPGHVYRDDGECGNPPPPWAPAHGWRRKCQGASAWQGELPPGLRRNFDRRGRGR